MNKSISANASGTFRCVYSNFHLAQKVISGLLPIDYFLAKEVCQTLLVDKFADKSANNQPIARESNVEQDYSLLFHLVIALNQASLQGNTCLPLNELANTRFGFLADEQGNVSHQGYIFPSLEALQATLTLCGIAPEHQQLIVYHQNSLYLRRYFMFEQELAQQINTRIKTNTDFSFADISKVVDGLFDAQPALEKSAANDIDWQKLAVTNALNKNFTVIAGGPGTGKTYTVTKLLAALVNLSLLQATAEETSEQQAIASKINEKSIVESFKQRFALVAPTGKAAQRLSESIEQAVKQFSGAIDDLVLSAIPTEALTIHRLLGYIPHQPNFRHHQGNQLELDFLLIDEASMVDLPMLVRVLRALPPQCKIVLLGDADQLPSVAVGSVLADIAPRPHPGVSAENALYIEKTLGYSLPVGKKATADHLTFLMKSRRFDGDGAIGKIAKCIISGNSDESWQQLLENKANTSTVAKSQRVNENDLTLIETKDSAELSYLNENIERYYLPLFQCQSVEQAFSLLSEFRVLTATRVGSLGVEAINQYCHDHFVRKNIISAHQTLYHAMPIMITENHQALGIYNGDVGIIWRNEAGHLMAMFEQIANEKNNHQAFKSIIPSRLPHFEAVYAMTIHKTQGSEFSHVFMITPEQGENKLLSRELLYTGVTRAKKQLTIMTNEQTWRQGVQARVSRFSNLALTS